MTRRTSLAFPFVVSALLALLNSPSIAAGWCPTGAYEVAIAVLAPATGFPRHVFVLSPNASSEATISFVIHGEPPKIVPGAGKDLHRFGRAAVPIPLDTYFPRRGAALCITGVSVAPSVWLGEGPVPLPGIFSPGNG